MGGFRVPIPARAGRTALLGSVGLLAALAWLALVAFGELAHGVVHLAPGAPGGHHGGGGGYALLFLAGWTVMCVAMMLPTSLPVLATLHALAGERRDRSALVALAGAGYLLVWAGFGVLVYGAARLVSVLAAGPGGAWIAGLGAPALLVLAGAFQFTSLKHRCLDRCRSPLSLVLGYWQGRAERWQSFRLGVDNGLFCLGCCWALMLLMFLAGVSYLVVMLGLGAVMAVEKNVAWGRRLSAPVGVALIAAGVVVAAARYLG